MVGAGEEHRLAERAAEPGNSPTRAHQLREEVRYEVEDAREGDGG